MYFILKMDNPQSPSDAGLATRIRLIGPLAPDYSVAQKQIKYWMKGHNPHDNPCWQLVDIENTTVEVVGL